MSIQAVYFDLGGVILRTEDKSPRTKLAGRFGLDYAGIEEIVFESDSGRRASTGAISETQHWRNVAQALKRPEDEWEQLRDQFVGGDQLDVELLAFLRSLRPAIKVGLISNAWDGMRPWIGAHQFDDVFDHMTISAELGIAKPQPGIYRHALEQLGIARPGQAAFFDDLPENVQGARDAGMQAFLFKGTPGAVAEIKRLIAE